MAKSKHPKQARRTTTITPASTTTTVVRFSPSAGAAAEHAQASALLYAHLVRSPDGHTVRVYDAASNKCVQRWSGHAASDNDNDDAVNAIAWASIHSPDNNRLDPANPTAAAVDSQASRGKKRRKSDAAASTSTEPSATTPKPPKLVLCLGLDNGSILVLSPTDGAAARSITLSHPTATAAITALAVPESQSASHVWSAHEDGTCRVWDLQTRRLVARTTGIAPGKKVDDLAVQYSQTSDKSQAHIIASHLSLSLYSTNVPASTKDKIKDLKATELGRCPGHVDKATVQWIANSGALEFCSYSPTDRFVQFWSMLEGRQDAVLQARLALDSGVQAVAVTSTDKVFAAVDADGKLSIAELMTASTASPSKGKNAVVTLGAKTEVVGLEGASAGIVSVAFSSTGRVTLSRGSVKPTFESVTYFDKEEGVWTPKVELGKATNLLVAEPEDDAGVSAPQRYTEKTAASSRPDVVAEPASDDDEIMANTGELDVDMAEPTLAERLKAMNVSKQANKKKAARGSDDEDEEEDVENDSDDDEDDESDSEGRPKTVVPATTLTTTLIQALHSSDGPLLESCLTHSSPTLIRSTVKRLPPGSLVLNLLEALVERLGRGKRGAKSLEAASVKRSRALIEWVKQVLVIHVGFLVTVPSLVTRLAALHASLTRRLALEPTLLALHGRLDLVVSQIDVKRDNVRRRIELSERRQVVGASRGTKYVEGESEDDDEEDDEDEEDVDMDDQDLDDEDSEVEDVLLGSQEEDEDVDEDDFGFDDAEDEDEDEEDEEDGDESKPTVKAKVNGSVKMGVRDMLDLEAEDVDDDESDDDDDDDDEDEDEDENESEDEESE
ncbi:Small subunit (SSU) processome component [Microbotryomycetes sp. JL201]|nr:Small subunit (SSU) processome component [Microbotryomycetes sp. JL201]